MVLTYLIIDIYNMFIQKEIFFLFLKDMERVPYRGEFHTFSIKDGSFRILFIQDMEVAENGKMYNMRWEKFPERFKEEKNEK